MRAILVILGMLVLALGAGLTSVLLYHTPRDYTATTTIIIPPHTSARATVNLLHEAGLAPSFTLIALPLYVSRDYALLKAGEYEFAPNLTPAQIIQKIARGQIVIHKISVPEGWNIWQVRAAFMAEPLLTGDLPAALSEGWIYPDTIRFQRGQTRASIIEQMQKRRSEELTAAWNTRDPSLPLSSPQQALILASIIEKETNVPEERPMVAAVFYNRLRLGMRLQTDPTVIYGIEAAHGGTPLGRALTTADLQWDTPYNSYTRDGLPPTPICNPSDASVQAALHPAQSQAIYFVATGHGGHYFSNTLAEHSDNVLNYRSSRAKQGHIKSPAK